MRRIILRECHTHTHTYTHTHAHIYIYIYIYGEDNCEADMSVL